MKYWDEENKKLITEEEMKKAASKKQNKKPENTNDDNGKEPKVTANTADESTDKKSDGIAKRSRK